MTISIRIIAAFCSLTLWTFGQDGLYREVAGAIANPDKVTELWVSSNEDSLPSEISKCQNIESIRFDNLNSSFDVEAALLNISMLPKLKEVHFWYFNESEPPVNLKELNQIEHIEFYSSPTLKLDRYFEQMKTLSKLDMLSLRDMNLASIPVEIIKLNKLKYLNLDNNDQLDLPQTCTRLSKLKIEILNLSSSKFNIIPKEITQLKSLKSLSLEMIQGNFNNEESYTILSQLENLESLNVQGNFFKAFDPSIALLASLKRIEVDGNCLNEEEFKKLKKLLPNTEVQNEIPC